jgi:arginyl-tRNA synthetase
MSILRKAKTNTKELDYSCLNNEYAFELVKGCCDVEKVIESALEKRDPSLVLKHTMEMCKILNKYYSVCKIIDGSDAEINAKIKLLLKVKQALENLFKLLCIDTIQEM